jgi:hypothetical protein
MKGVFVIILITLMTFSCKNNDNSNEKNNLIIKQKENTIEKLKKENISKGKKIQSLMDELSTCKESKIAIINKESTNSEYSQAHVLGDKEKSTFNNNDGGRSNATTVMDVALLHPPKDKEGANNEGVLNPPKEEKKEFLPPQNIIGECKKSDIHRVFHNLTPYFKKCFENNNIKRGILEFSWIINESGSVVKVDTIKNNTSNRDLSNCLMSIIKSGRYNSPKHGMCNISYTFKL